MKDKDIKEIKVVVAKAMAEQAAQQGAGQAQMQMQMIKNGGVSQAVNSATVEFTQAAKILKRLTKDYTIVHSELAVGLQYSASQQIYRISTAGAILDSLGYQAVTEVLVHLHPNVEKYIAETMSGWNNIITSEGDVAKIFEEIEAEEKAASKERFN